MNLKFIAVALVVVLGACSQRIEPVMDLKVSKNPGEAQMDWMGCEWLAHKYGLDDMATIDCLKGRGHSVIGVTKR